MLTLVLTTIQWLHQQRNWRNKMCDEYTDSKNDKVIKLTEKEYNELWWNMQWNEDKQKMLQQEKKLNGLVKWLGI